MQFGASPSIVQVLESPDPASDLRGRAFVEPTHGRQRPDHNKCNEADSFCAIASARFPRRGGTARDLSRERSQEAVRNGLVFAALSTLLY